MGIYFMFIPYATFVMLELIRTSVPIAIQFLWALILGGGIAWLPESPRYYVKRGKVDQAIKSLSSLRGQPADSEFIQAELSEIIANHEYEYVTSGTSLRCIHCVFSFSTDTTA